MAVVIKLMKLAILLLDFLSNDPWINLSLIVKELDE
jgi:hypothetical protein